MNPSFVILALAVALSPQIAHAASGPSPHVSASAWDETSGQPTFIWATAEHPRAPGAHRVGPEAAARWYLAQHASRWGAARGEAEGARVHLVHDTGRGGIVVVFHQAVRGVPVIHSRVSILLDRELKLVAIGGGLVDSRRAQRPEAFVSTAYQAVARAAADGLEVPIPLSALYAAGDDDGGWQRVELSLTPDLAAARRRFHHPARARRVLYPTAEGLVRAWDVEISPGPWGGHDAETLSYVIGDDGALLFKTSLVDQETYTYRVWAETQGDMRPLPGPYETFHPHPTGENDGTFPDYIEPQLVSVEGLSFSPERDPDPWLPAGSGETRGNNVVAYADHYEPDGFDQGDVIGHTRSAGSFDWAYDTAASPLSDDEQTQAAITQLFYTTNWMHDWYYDSGFNEAAGNAQMDNYGRGGAEGDPMNAEAQDSAPDILVRNNANMATPADGASPRMQMYLWRGLNEAELRLQGQGQPINVGIAFFGPQTFDVTGRLQRPGDRDGNFETGCEPFENATPGRILLSWAPTCTFQSIAEAAEAAGAIGVIIGHSTPGEPAYNMTTSTPERVVNIPLFSTTYEDMSRLADAAEGIAFATMDRVSEVERDSDLDNMVVTHEWGHYLHRRLVAPCSTQQCRSISEGMADYVALHMIYPEGGARDGVYSHSIYASNNSEDAGYFGTRRVAYSTDMSVDPWSFRHVQDGEPLPFDDAPIRYNGQPNSESHGAGEVWASMMWDGYMALMASAEGDDAPRTFDEVQRLAGDDLVTAYMLSPVETTFIEQRDAVLAAIAARDAADYQSFIEAFARRGMGSCAQGPDRDSATLTGVVEDSGIRPRLELIDLALVEGDGSCDQDGILDAGETGHIRITVANFGGEVATGAQVSLSGGDHPFTALGSDTAATPDIMPGGSVEVFIPIVVDPDLDGMGSATVNLTLAHGGSCRTVVMGQASARINADNHPEGQTIDRFESDILGWGLQTDLGIGPVWAIEDEGDGDAGRVMHGEDAAGQSDSSLVSPVLMVGDTGLTLTLRHRHQFEASEFEGQLVYWDGGVIEIREGDGPWEDASLYTDVPYGGMLTDQAENPLSLRQAFVATNPSWPQWDELSLDFGDAFQGRAIQLRLRLGADLAVGDEGWFIDDVSFKGLTNAPFPWVEADQSALESRYVDGDGDGYGAGDALPGCGDAEGFSRTSDDCDDGDASVYPGADEPPGAASDLNCDGAVETPTPTPSPTQAPTPTAVPTAPPTPTPISTAAPTPAGETASQPPTATPTFEVPTGAPPTQAPTASPTAATTASPAASPTPTDAPTLAPTQAPTDGPTQAPTDAPSPTEDDGDGGCACRSGGASPVRSAWVWLFGAVVALARRRR